MTETEDDEVVPGVSLASATLIETHGRVVDDMGLQASPWPVCRQLPGQPTIARVGLAPKLIAPSGAHQRNGRPAAATIWRVKRILQTESDVSPFFDGQY
jgi:hypothetical protein